MKGYFDLIAERLAFTWYRTGHLRKRSSGRKRSTVQDVLLATKRYVRNELSEHLGIERGTPISIELPIKGLTNLLWLVRLGERRCMLYCYMPDQWPRMDQQVTALQLSQQHDVRMPRIVHTLADLKKYGLYFVATEFVDGVSRAGKQQVIAPDELRCVADQLARMHSVQGDKWGRLCLPRQSDYFARQMRLVERYLGLARKRSMLTSGQQQQMREWFSKWRSAFGNVSRYSLIHGDLHPNNILFLPDGACALLDTDRVAWNLPMWDIALVHDRICRRDPTRIEQFDSGYLAALSPDMCKQHETLIPFFEALHRLRVVMREVDEDTKTNEVPHSDYWSELLRTCSV